MRHKPTFWAVIIAALCMGSPVAAADYPSWYTEEDIAEAQERADERAAQCTLPRARPDEEVVLLGVYDGETQPTVAVAGQDESTGLVRVEIEDGATPLYLVLAAYEPTIWRFDGAVDRLVRVVAIPRSMPDSGRRWAGTGELGLPRDKVKFSRPGNCGWYFSKPDSPEGRAMTKAVRRAIGRAPDHVIGHYSATTVVVPSGAVKGPGYFSFTEVLKNGEIVGAETDWGAMFNGGWDLIRQEDWLAKPAGIEAVDPDALLAPGHVETYQVLPAQDGLRQLVAEGKLLRRDRQYRIVQPIQRIPAGLSGSHMVEFLLMKGVPKPKGDLGHSALIMEGAEYP